MEIFKAYDIVLLQETQLGKKGKKPDVEVLAASLGSMKINSKLEEGQSKSINEVGEEREEEDNEEIFQFHGFDELILEDKKIQYLVSARIEKCIRQIWLQGPEVLPFFSINNTIV